MFFGFQQSFLAPVSAPRIQDILGALSSKTYPTILPAVHDLLYSTVETPSVACRIHEHVLNQTIISPQIPLLAELVSDVIGDMEDDERTDFRSEIVQRSQDHFVACKKDCITCCVANVMLMAHLFNRRVVGERAILGITHRLLFGHPSDSSYMPTSKQLIMVCILLAEVGSQLENCASPESAISEIIQRIKQVKPKAQPYDAVLLELLVWAKARKWDRAVCSQVIHAAHRCVMTLTYESPPSSQPSSCATSSVSSPTSDFSETAHYLAPLP